MFKLIVIIIVIFFFNINFALAQTNLFNHTNLNFTTPQVAGRPLVSGWNYFEDKHGFIWICSPEGLQRFDGVHLKRYVAIPGRSTSIQNNWVKRMVEIGDNEYLIATKNGLSIFNSTKQIFKRYYLPNELDADTYRIEDLNVVGNSILILGANSIYEYNKTNRLSIKIPIEFEYQKKLQKVTKFAAMSMQGDSVVWFQSANPVYGLVKYNLLNKQTNFIPFPNNIDPINIAYDEHGYLWLLSWGKGIYRYHIKKNTFENANEIGFTGKGSDGILVEPNRVFINSMWGTGFYIYDYKTNKFAVHKLDIERKTSYQGYTTTGPIFKDSKNRYWLCANGQTIILDPLLNQINAFQLPIKKFRIGFNMPDAIPINNLNGIIFNDFDRPLAWYYNLLKNKYDTLNIGFIAEEIIIDEKMQTITFKNFKYKQVFIYTINKQTGEAIFNATPKFELKKFEILKTFTDTFGNKFIHNNGYINLIKANDTKNYNFEDLFGFKDRVVNMLLSPNKDQVWFGTWNNGIFSYNASSRKLENFSKKTLPNYMAGNEVGAIAFDGENNVWWCEMNTGIIIYNPTKKSYKLLNNKDGINITSISQLYYDGKGRMWVGLQNGIHYINTKSLAIRHFSSIEGNEAFNTLSSLKPINDSAILLFTGRYFNLINTNTIDAKPMEPTVNISEVICNQQPVNFLIFDNNIFKYNQNNISISFSAMEYSLPGNINYQYQLLPISKDWINIPIGQHEITFEALAPNKYTLKLKASNIKGEFSNKETFYYFTIRPAFWQTWWFRIMLVLFLAAIIYGAYRYRLNQYKKLQNIRNNISSNLHDDIGSSLTNIGMLNELAKRSITEPQKAKGYLAQACDDIQRISENLNDIVWNVNPGVDNANDLLIRMKRYAADMLEAKNINGNFNFTDIKNENLNMEQRRNLYLIFKEAINNLTKYSQAKNATISIIANKKQLILTITDDGIGFNQNNQNQSNGLKNMLQRAKIINGSLLISSQQSMGCTICLTMPI